MHFILKRTSSARFLELELFERSQSVELAECRFNYAEFDALYLVGNSLRKMRLRKGKKGAVSQRSEKGADIDSRLEQFRQITVITGRNDSLVAFRVIHKTAVPRRGCSLCSLARRARSLPFVACRTRGPQFPIRRPFRDSNQI